MADSVKQKARRFCREYKVYKLSEKQIENIIETMGFTIVEYSPVFNNGDVNLLVEELGLKAEVARSNGFTYVSGRYRLVFINENLSEEEKRIVLIHEMGHIYCEHFSHTNIVGLDVKDEYEANEFAHYVMQPSLSEKINRRLFGRKKFLAAAAVLIVLICIIGVSAVKEESYYGEYYVTESGHKYHEAECIHIENKTNVHRLTKEEFESGEYEPCKVCLP
ncbi:MAG: ImmA/IrrE family metallo-endopeptidase [Clostridiales bacterium]|nr:ImmA/IrrE family metallo-endopeptidase [Clostridiales bacterium]